MFKTIRKFCSVVILALLMASILAADPPRTAASQSLDPPEQRNSQEKQGINLSDGRYSTTSYASSHGPSATETGLTIDRANVYTKANTGAPIDHVDAPNTTVTIYATVSSQIVWNGNSTWYRISPLNSNPLYIYGGLVTVSDGNRNSAHSSTSSGLGKIIVVSISQQELDAYDNGQLFVSVPVATGRSELPTLTGTYHIFAKYSPYTFISPWPVGSPDYYPPSTANYAMEWAQGGYFIHDAPWRGYFGKGANYWHWDPLMGEDPGTHGCVNVPTSVMAQLFNWATIGTTVQINP